MPPQGHPKRKSGASAVSGQEKRTRVSRACDQCRIAREKCDGAQPICSTCSGANRSCGYTSNPKKRGIQPGYIRTLELALTWLFQNSDAEATLSRKLAQEGASSVLLSRDSKESNKLHKTWRKSKFCREVDRLLSGEQAKPEEEGLPSDDDEDSDIEGVDTNSAFQQQPMTLPQQETPPNIDSVQTAKPDSVPQRTIEPARQPYPHIVSPLPQETNASGFVSLPSDTWRLLEIYFTYTQCWLPICDKNDILKMSYSYPERGLLLSPNMPDSGLHAELWSVLAMASVQESSSTDAISPQNPPSLSPRQLYAIAKCAIPDELGSFDIGHIKALLNLAVFNLSQGLAEAAWLLVGSASRVLMTLTRSSQNTNARQKHTLSSCYVLDHLLSTHLQRRPYIQKTDVDQLGKIEEDGLEEWQPWTSCFLSSPTLAHRSSMPALGLSSFNNLVEVMDILASAAVPENVAYQDSVARLEVWKASLPAKFDYIRSESSSTPSTPPALLLHLAYYSTALTLFPSQAWVQRALDLLERFRERLGVASFPPVIHCLIEHMKIRGSHLALDQRLHSRLQRIQTFIAHTWSLSSREILTGMQEPQSAHSRHSFGAAQMPTPDSIQIISGPSIVQNNGQGPGDSRPRTNSTLLEELLPDMNAATSASTGTRQAADPRPFAMSPFENIYNPDPRNPSVSTDVENFFDELASLDGADKLGNRPQFMQNLGFAPDVNMADFLAAEFSQFIPMHSSTFIPQNNQEAVQFDQNTFYDGS